MSIVINGTGSISGLAVGGLPDGTVDAGTLATDSVVTGKIADGTIANADIADLAASKLTGALPAISGASLTGIVTGKVLQVLHYSSSGMVTFPQNTSVNTLMLSGAITPSATSSKILTIQYLDLGLQGGNYPALHSQLNRGSASISTGNLHGYMDTQNFDRRFAYTKVHLDSPNTTSATTYYIYGGNTSGSGFSGTYNGRGNVSAPSTLTLIEIGA